MPVPATRVLLAGKDARPSVLVKWTMPAYAVAVLLKASSAVTLKLKATPDAAVAGATTAKCVAAPAETVMAPDVPVIEAVTVSVAVTVWLPAVFKVRLKLPTPLTRVVLGGSTAAPSVEVK
jgi:hypothetical protein